MTAAAPAAPALAHLTLTEASEAIAQGRTSAEQLLTAALAQAEQTNPTTRAFLRIDAEAALSRARALDHARAAGQPVGPLHGIPLAHKDMFYRAGVPSSCGARIPLPIPTVTATVLSRLDAAGAVSFGVLNMAEFAYGPTGHNWTHGHCRNPWQPDYITGGSSSGSAAAVAARACYAALGSDTGASIRVPAACCGITGLKTTAGRVSRAGVMGLSSTLDTVGPLARTAEDCARVMQVIAGPDPADPTTDPAPVPDYLHQLRAPVAGLRIGLPMEYFDGPLDPEVARAMADSHQALRDLGCELVPVRCPDMDTIDAASALVMASEAAARHANLMQSCPDGHARQVAARLARGLAVPAVSYIQALRYRAVALAAFLRDVFDHVDVLHTPVLPILTPRIDDTDVHEGEALDALLSTLTRYSRPFNYLGLPALSLPAGRSTAGLPIGMQWVGRPHDEPLLLRLGHAYQAATAWHRHVPPGASASPSSPVHGRTA